MQLFPLLQTEDLILRATAFRPGPEVREHLVTTHSTVPDHRDCIPETDFFCDLYCSSDARSIAMQYEVLTTTSEDLIGCATLMELDPHARHVRAGVFVVPCVDVDLSRGARALTTNAAFALWNVRKVYAREVHERWRWQAPSAIVEGTLREYLLQGTHHLDMDVTATYRRDWDVEGVHLVEALVNDRPPPT